MKDTLFTLLEDLVAFRSVSSDPQYATESQNLVEYLSTWMIRHGIETQIVQGPPDTNPVILGRRIVDPQAPTLFFYNHYDVQPASESDQSSGFPRLAIRYLHSPK